MTYFPQIPNKPIRSMCTHRSGSLG